MGNRPSSSSSLHLTLLGDSTIDNGAWTGGGPSVFDQVQELLPHTTLCAKDGALISAIASQAAKAPSSTTHFVVSVGGNDGISGINVMTQRTETVAEGVEALHLFAQEFENEYFLAIESLIRQVGADKHVVLCSIYNPCFGPLGVTTLSQAAANACVCLLADSVLRVACRLSLPVIDWRRVMTEVEDFANPIEPSSQGGGKMAEVIAQVVRRHPWGRGHSVVYPQKWPRSQIGAQARQDLVPRDRDGMEEGAAGGEQQVQGQQQEQQQVQHQQEGAGRQNVLEDPAAAALVQRIRETSSPSAAVVSQQPLISQQMTPPSPYEVAAAQH